MSDSNPPGSAPVPAETGWTGAYALVLAALAIEIVLFWLLGAFYGGAGA